jgi:hypothetical protein
MTRRNGNRRIIQAGARRGAEALLPHLAHWEKGGRRSFGLAYVDPVPGRAESMAERARAQGLDAGAEEAAIEDFLPQSTASSSHSTLILSLDHPRALSRAFAVSAGLPTLAYQLWQFPTGHLAGFQAVVAPEQDAERQRLAALFVRLDELASRQGSETILGLQAGTNRVVEPLYREGFGRHLTRNLPKLAAGLAPEDPAVGLVLDGRTPEPAVIVESPRGWKTEAALLEETSAMITDPLTPGDSRLLLELGPDGLRAHRLRLRRVDRKVDVTTVTGAEPGIVQPRLEEEKQPRSRRGMAALGLTTGALLLTD